MFRVTDTRVQSLSENENALHRKSVNQTSRSAFVDLHANRTHVQKESASKAKPKEPEYNAYEDICSYFSQPTEIGGKDTMEDILPLSQRFTFGDVMKILDSYTGDRRTPPPSPNLGCEPISFDFTMDKPMSDMPEPVLYNICL